MVYNTALVVILLLLGPQRGLYVLNSTVGVLDTLASSTTRVVWTPSVACSVNVILLLESTEVCVKSF